MTEVRKTSVERNRSKLRKQIYERDDRIAELEEENARLAERLRALEGGQWVKTRQSTTRQG